MGFSGNNIFYGNYFAWKAGLPFKCIVSLKIGSWLCRWQIKTPADCAKCAGFMPGFPCLSFICPPYIRVKLWTICSKNFLNAVSDANERPNAEMQESFQPSLLKGAWLDSAVTEIKIFYSSLVLYLCYWYWPIILLSCLGSEVIILYSSKSGCSFHPFPRIVE